MISLDPADHEIRQEKHYYPFGLHMEHPDFWVDYPAGDRYQYNSIENLSLSNALLYAAHYRTLDPSLGRWLQVDPASESFYGLTPYNSMGNNPIAIVDPLGDFIFVIPQISFSGGGVTVGVEIGIGIPGLGSFSISGGFGHGGGYWSAQVYAAGFYVGYGNNGGFAGWGYRWANMSIGFSFSGNGWSIGLNYGTGFAANGIAASWGVSYGSNGFGHNVGLSNLQEIRKRRAFTPFPFTPVDPAALEFDPIRIEGLGLAELRLIEDTRGLSDHDLVINRIWWYNRSTISEFYIPGTDIEGYFLEPTGPATTVRDQNKRIPTGVYNLKWNLGSRFPGALKLFNDEVPRDRGILIHRGFTYENTSGCLLPGTNYGQNSIGNTRPAYNAIIQHFQGIRIDRARVIINYLY